MFLSDSEFLFVGLMIMHQKSRLVGPQPLETCPPQPRQLSIDDNHHGFHAPAPNQQTTIQSPRQPSIDDNRYGFHAPTPTQQTTIQSTLAQPRPSHAHSQTPPHSQTPLRSQTPPHSQTSLHSRTPLHSQIPPHSQTLRSSTPDVTGSHDSEADDEEVEGENMEPEIDEQSDDEDDRQAHAFLRASPNQTMVTVSQPPVPHVQRATVTTTPRPLPPTGQGHLGFAVSIIPL